MHLTASYRLLLCVAALFIAGCSSEFSADVALGEELNTTSTLAELRSRFTGSTVRIESDIVVAGRVTSSDRAGNFYRSLTIEQEGAAAEVMVGLDALHNDYPIGTKLYICLRDLAIGERLGVLQIGLMPTATSWYATDYLASKAQVDQHIVRSTDPIAELMPTTLRIEELTPIHCGRLIRIDKVQYVPDEEPAIWSGYRCFKDEDNHLIYTYVRTYADFADEPIPTTTGALVGILQYDPTGDGRYLIKLRDATDFIP